MRTCAGIILAGILLLGCGSDDTTAQPPEDRPQASMTADEELYTKASKEMVRQFGSALKSTLLGALNEYGTAYAVRICRDTAQELVAAHATDTWRVKRVSEKWRNVNDRPDTAEVRVLKTFADPATADNYLVSWTGDDTSKVFHYYQKITVSPMCLQCHGDLQTVDLDLWTQIRKAYPYDKATGYKEGDLRGMFVVTAEWPEGRELAEKLVEGIDITSVAAVDSLNLDLIPTDTTGATVE